MGKKRPFSIFGSIIGFIALSIIITAISFILNDYFSRLDYNFNSYTDNLSVPDINLTDFKLGFKLVNATGGDYPDLKRFFKMSAIFWDIYNPKLGENITTISVNKTIIPLIKCNQYRKNSLFYENFAFLSKNHIDSECLDFESLNKSLIGSYGDLGRYN
jgi:TM2 domain-containing membrane protein YozV